MSCKICNQEKVTVIYEGQIRDGRFGQKTNSSVKMFQCTQCETIWHEPVEKDYEDYYTSTRYREKLENTSSIQKFYEMHDEESLQKLTYTGTKIFRDKLVMDIGCGGGAFLDYLLGVARKIIGIEPSKAYRDEMTKKGYKTFPYMKEAISEYANHVDIITSFDVIEHVEQPGDFLREIYQLLNKKGQAIIGTPTQTPIMCSLLGTAYKEFLFSVQHPWIFNEASLKILAKQVGFSKVEIKYYQRYGIGNCISWLINKEPKGNVEFDFVSATLDEVWKTECSTNKLSDYIVLYVEK